jgi:histidinol-phosphate aminotransferase
MTRPLPRPGTLSIEAYVPGRIAFAGPESVFQLASNESALGPSPRAIDALDKAMTEIARYPDGSAYRLRETIGICHDLDPARIIVGAGSDQILELLAQAYIGPGDVGLFGQYGFLRYRIVTAAAGGIPVAVPEKDFRVDVDAILAHVSERTKIVFLANPGNPTGSYLSAGEVARLARELPKRTILVLDAAYAEYVAHDDYEAGAALVDTRENVVMTRTFSKIYGLAGLRLGWAYGPAHVIDALHRIRSPFNVSSAASTAGIAALQDGSHLDAARAHNRFWLSWLTREIGTLGLEVLPSVANFLAIRFSLGKGGTAAHASSFLEQRGIVLRPLDSYGMNDFLRLTVGTREANEAVVGVIVESVPKRTLRS